MKLRRIILFLFFVFVSLAEKSHAQAFYEGMHLVSVGLGAGGRYINFDKTGSTPELNFIYEFGLGETRATAFGVGAYFGKKMIINHIEFEPEIFEESKWKFTTTGLFGTVHYRTRSRFDPYVMTILGVRYMNYVFVHSVRHNKYPLSNPYPSGHKETKFAPGLQTGVRWYWSNNISAYLEAGYGFHFISGGINVTIY